MSIFDSDDFNDRLFYPRSDSSAPPLGATDHFVDVDGARLHLRIHPGGAACRLLLLFHGNGEVVADYDALAARFAAAHTRLAVVDYRGYGLSSGVPSLRAVMDDAPIVATFVAGLEAGPVIVMGRSLGSACAHDLIAAGDAAPSAFILDSGFSDLAGLVARRGMSCPHLSAQERTRFDPLLKIKRLKRPILIVHGEDDTLISCEEARVLFDATSYPDRRLAIIPDFGHNDLFASPSYWSVLSEFVGSLSP